MWLKKKVNDNMAHPSCPLSVNDQPHKCKWCPIPPMRRIVTCKFYRSQIVSGVPWHCGADMHWYTRDENLSPQAVRERAVEIAKEKEKF